MAPRSLPEDGAAATGCITGDNARPRAAQFDKKRAEGNPPFLFTCIYPKH